MPRAIALRAKVVMPAWFAAASARGPKTPRSNITTFSGSSIVANRPVAMSASAASSPWALKPSARHFPARCASSNASSAPPGASARSTSSAVVMACSW